MEGNNATFEVKFGESNEINVSMETEKTFGVDFDNVIIKVPKNYGLITWNGTVLTVS